MLSKVKCVNIFETLKKYKIIPITTFNNVNDALKIAELLVKNSYYLLEITLRSEIAFKCLEEISKKFPEIFLGSGSVLSQDALKKAIDSGAQFAVSPCLDADLIDYSLSNKITFIPGIATPSELNIALQKGLELIKIFPVTNLGGPSFIKSVAAPFKITNFHLIPTGSIKENNIKDYIALERVIACGASFIIDSKLVEANDMNELNIRINKTKELLSLTE